jgi:hypothetical protein
MIRNLILGAALSLSMILGACSFASADGDVGYVQVRTQTSSFSSKG